MQTLFITPQQLANRWNIKLGTLSLWRWKKKGPPFLKIGHRILYKLEEIEVFEKQKHISSVFFSQNNTHSCV